MDAVAPVRLAVRSVAQFAAVASAGVRLPLPNCAELIAIQKALELFWPMPVRLWVLSPAAIDEINPFDRVQLAETIRVCRISRSLSEAGRTLFFASRARRSTANDADRLRQYLARFGLGWGSICQMRMAKSALEIFIVPFSD